MITSDATRRWCLGTTAAVFALTVLTGCSGGSSPTAKPAAGTSPAASTAPAATPDPAAAAARARAETVTKALRSYAFQATQRLSGGAKVQQTTLTGRAVRPRAVSYDVNVAGKHELVIKIAGRTFVRVPPGTWKALAKPGPTVDPVASLLPLLDQLTGPSLTGHILRGTVPANVLSAAGLAPAGATSTTRTVVTFTLDAAGHVTSVALQLKVKAGTSTLILDESTTFTRFNTAPPIKAPGAVK